MNTASTRPAARKADINSASSAKARQTPPELSTRLCQQATAAILVCAALLRFYHLELKPLHHDEGVNGFFLTRLVRDGFYHYDPANYHGSTLYYFALVPTLFRFNTFAIRIVPVVFGLVTILLILYLRRYLGTIGALTAAALVAVSPGAVYYSRYFIHETLLVCFTVGAVVAALSYGETKRPSHLMLVSVLAALMFATKETATIAAVVLLVAAIGAHIYIRFKGRLSQDSVKQSGHRPDRSRFARSALWVLSAAALFIAINLAFYSSFLTYAGGVKGALETFAVWRRTSEVAHTKPWHTYLGWLLQEDSPSLLLGMSGAGLALWRGESRFTIFAALWSLGILAAYSLVPYKTPWLTLNMIVPLAIVGGHMVNVVYKRGKMVLAVALVCVAVTVSACQAISLNFFHYDDENSAYPYMHTRREFLQLVNKIDQLAEEAGTGAGTRIAVLAPEYWPLPWYLRDYRNAGFFGTAVRVPDAAIVVAAPAQEMALQSSLGQDYQRIDVYPLRPAVSLVLYARRALGGSPRPSGPDRVNH